jgi:ribosome modulation factor
VNPLAEDTTRYTAPPDMSAFDPDADGHDNAAYFLGREDHKEGKPRDAIPFATTHNRTLWVMGWDYENQKTNP